MKRKSGDYARINSGDEKVVQPARCAASRRVWQEPHLIAWPADWQEIGGVVELAD